MMMITAPPFDLTFPHRRFNPLLGTWVLNSPQRSQRPWAGHQVEDIEHSLPPYAPDCPLCPGNKRVNGVQNPEYKDIFVFDNDFPALTDDPRTFKAPYDALLKIEPITGVCRVVCFTARHDLTLADLTIRELNDLFRVLTAQQVELAQHYRWVQIFENKGKVMGSSQPHPHFAIWATSYVPSTLWVEHVNQKAYFLDHGSAMLLDYARLESSSQERVVLLNDSWLAVVPFWALWPFEVLIVPTKRHIPRFEQICEVELNEYVQMLSKLLKKYDKLFNVSFPYAMGWHGAPYLADSLDFWQTHTHIFPPLLRSASIRKFWSASEMLTEGLRDLTPERAASILRRL